MVKFSTCSEVAHLASCDEATNSYWLSSDVRLKLAFSPGPDGGDCLVTRETPYRGVTSPE